MAANHRLSAWAMVLMLMSLSTRFAGFAQLPTGTILGVVKDTTGAVVPESTITVRNTDTGQSRSAVSATDGSYRFAALAVGNYEIRAEHPGFQTEIRSGVILTVAQDAVVNFTLEVGAVTQTVQVAAEAPLVNTTSGSLGGLVSEQKMVDLPLNGRNYASLMLLQPGIVQNTNVTGANGGTGIYISSNGAPTRSNNYLLDGTPIVNFLGAVTSSVTGSTLGVDGILEYRVLTLSFGAEYGTSMGSQTVMVSKSGTNQVHGTLFEFLRNSDLDARNFFDLKSVATGADFRLPPFKRNNFGGSLGGPIKKDKTFIFGVYEGLRQRLGATPISTVMAPGCHGAAGATITNAACPQLGATASVQISPVTAPLLAIFPNPNLPKNQLTFPETIPSREDYWQVRVDHIFSQNDKIFGRYTFDDASAPGLNVYPGFTNFTVSREQFATLSEDHVFTPAIMNSFRLSYSRPKKAFGYGNDFSGPQFSFIPGMPIGGIAIGGLTATQTANPNLQKANVYLLGDDLFYTHGRHSLKMGTLFAHYQQVVNLGNQIWGTVTFPNVASFLQAQPSTYGALTPGSIYGRDWRFYVFGNYLQDDLRLSSNLTLNLGLRYEFATQIREAHGHSSALPNILTDSQVTVGIPFKNASLKNVSPRVGFAWDIKGNGKTVVRGGVAVLYDTPTNLGNALNSLATGTPPFSSQTTVANPTTFTIPFTLPVSAATTALRLLQYHMGQPRIVTDHLTLERQLPLGIVATLTYAGSRGYNIMNHVDGNPNLAQILPDGRQFWPLGAPRTNPHFGTIEYFEGAGDSWYHSFQFGLVERLSHGLQFQSSYAFSKLIDLKQGLATGDATPAFTVDPARPNVDRGPADFDVTQVYHFNAIYNLPQLSSKSAFLGKLLNGWWVSGILSLQTGRPFVVTLQADRSRVGINGGASGIGRPDLVLGRNNGNITSGVSTGCLGVPAGTPLGTPTLYFDPCAFTIPAAGFLGTEGRNILRVPGLANLDFSLVKDTALPILRESGKLEFRAEVFNILNRPNFSPPNQTVFAGVQNVESPLTGAATITSTATASRQIQFALKLIF